MSAIARKVSGSAGVFNGLLNGLSDQKSGAKRYYLLPTSCSDSEPLWVVPRGLGFAWTDLDLPNVFPNGCHSMCIKLLPGTDLQLPTAWRIYMDTGRYAAPMNQSVKKKFGVDWAGNIVMAKHRRRSDRIAQVACGEEDFADVILSLWLREFMYVKDRLGARLHFGSSF
ncbi:hypothetical protein C8R47DRAFT_1066100 [Mycena vitilis]|nr:hypothetical protein C8R47DRAFT_1066100 [Mycena vitilis]